MSKANILVVEDQESIRHFVVKALEDEGHVVNGVGSVREARVAFEGAADKMTYVATQELGLFDAKFAPYPYPVLNVVELDYNDGQENDGLVFLSSAFFDAYNGGVKNNMVTIGVHEIAQWRVIAPPLWRKPRLPRVPVLIDVRVGVRGEDEAHTGDSLDVSGR